MKSFPPLSRTKLSGIRKLLQRKYRAEMRKFLVEGVRSVEEALTSGWKVDCLLLTHEFTRDSSVHQIIERIRDRHVDVYSISAKDLEKVSETAHAQGVLAVVEQKAETNGTMSPARSHGLAVAVDGVAEPGNLGTIIRTCDWFGVETVLIGNDSVELYNPKVVRSSMGSIFHLTIVRDVKLTDEIGKLSRKGFRICVTSVERGEEINRVHWGERTVIVLGNEARGVSPSVAGAADVEVRIPRFGKAESLNVGIACGVILASIRLHRTPNS